MLREELKSKNFIIKDSLQTIKEMKIMSVSAQSIPSSMSSSEADLVPANNSVAIIDIYNNNDELKQQIPMAKPYSRQKKQMIIYLTDPYKTNLKK